MHGEIDIGDAVNLDSPLNQGIVGWWYALPGQQRGNVFRDLLGRNHGALLGGATYGGGRPPGGHGALSLDGSNDEVSIASNSGLNLYPITVSAWFRTSDTTDTYGVVAKYPAGSANGYLLYIANGNLFGWYFKDGSNYVYNGASGMSGGAVADGEWHNAVMTIDAGGGVLYLDGKSKATRVWTGTPGATTQADALRIGRFSAGGVQQYFTGNINDVVLASRAWSESEVWRRYHASRQGYPNELNWLRRRTYSFQAATTNRRRRLICGAAA